MGEEKNSRKSFLRSFLSGIIAFNGLLNSSFAGIYSPKEDVILELEDKRMLKLEAGSEYHLEKEFNLGWGKKLISKVEVEKNKISRGFITKQFLGPTRRITYDVVRKNGQDLMHMNILKNEKRILKNLPKEIPISPGSYEEIVLEKIIQENRYMPKTPSRFVGKPYKLTVVPRRGSKLFYKDIGKTSFKFIKGKKPFRIDPSKSFKNATKVTGTKASGVELEHLATASLENLATASLENLVAASLADGPEFGPIDALLALWLMYDGVNVVSDMVRYDPTKVDLREHNRTLKIRYPERFENSPIDVSPVTGHVIVKNPLNYYSNFPEPYRTYMYNVMKRNAVRYGTSKETVEKAFSGQNYSGKGLGYQLSEKERREMLRSGHSSQGYIYHQRRPDQGYIYPQRRPGQSYIYPQRRPSSQGYIPGNFPQRRVITHEEYQKMKRGEK